MQSLSQERFLNCLKSDIWTVTDDGNHIHNAGAIKFDWFADILLLSEEILAPICNFPSNITNIIIGVLILP